MATRKAPQPDHSTETNRRILADRQKRVDIAETQRANEYDLGLNLKDPASEADNPVEFLADEWDRKNFGDAIPTYTRVIYGPDTLLSQCPDMKTRIEQYGLEQYANATSDAIMTKGEKAVPDPVLQKGLRAAIERFGAASVANAFKERIMKIPQRTVEVEAERSDEMIYSKPFEEAVLRYGTPGMAPKFLSPRCIDVLGHRGYRIVKNENGDPVKVGTLIMGEIPIAKAEARRRHFAEESQRNVNEVEQNFADTASRAIHDSRGGVSVLQSGDSLRSNAVGDLSNTDETSAYLGRDYAVGFTTERQA